MNDERLDVFMDKVKIYSKDLAVYTNKEKGLVYPLSVASLLCRVDMLELGTSKNPAGELEKAKFEGKIEDKDYKILDLKKVVPKSDITKKKEDMFILVDKTYKGVRIYNVANQLGIHSTFEDKKEAFKLCEKINKIVIEAIKK
jgi:hypothetical protein